MALSNQALAPEQQAGSVPIRTEDLPSLIYHPLILHLLIHSYGPEEKDEG